MTPEVTPTHPFQFSFTTCFKERIVAEFLEGRVGGRLLEMGCGSAYFATALRRHLPSTTFQYHGVDIEPDAVAVAQQFVKGDDVVKAGSVMDLPYQDDYFDSIIYLDVIEHVQDEKKSLLEAYRVLKKGGTLVLSTPNSAAPFTDTFLCEYMHDHGHMANHRSGFTAAELENLLTNAGFKVEQVGYSNFLLSEILITITKLGYRLKKPKYNSQADVIGVSKSIAFQIHRLLVFPIGYALGRLEEFLLSSWLPGHCLILRATK